MRTWGMMIVLALGAAACGSGKATCKKVMERTIECTSEQMGSGTLVGKDEMSGMANELIDQVCDNGEAQSAAGELSSCMSESSCDAFMKCVEAKAPKDPAMDLLNHK